MYSSVSFHDPFYCDLIIRPVLAVSVDVLLVLDSARLFLLFPRAQSRLSFERFTHARQQRVDPRTIMGELDGTLGQLGDPLHLFADRPPAVRVGRQTGKGLK